MVVRQGDTGRLLGADSHLIVPLIGIRHFTRFYATL